MCESTGIVYVKRIGVALIRHLASTYVKLRTFFYVKLEANVQMSLLIGVQGLSGRITVGTDCKEIIVYC